MPGLISGRWLELSLDAANEAVDAVAEVIRSHGIDGIAVEPRLVPGNDEKFTIGEGPTVVRAYIPMDQESGGRVLELDTALWHLRAFGLAPVSELRTREVEEEDWANAWKEHFHPLRIGRRIVIRPSWRQFDARPSDVVVDLDPGMAFGTGLHPTTRMVLEAMENRVPIGGRVFDVGTGSGILAVAAAKLGAGEVLAVDSDPVAVRVAAENAALNGVGGVVTVRQGSAESGTGDYDVVLANIVASVIAGLAHQLAARLAASGTLIASGIIAERRSMVDAALAEARLDVIETRRSGDWRCLIGAKP